MKTLAIITPTYNRAKYLESVYNSLENHDMIWYNIIVREYYTRWHSHRDLSREC